MENIENNKLQRYSFFDLPDESYYYIPDENGYWVKYQEAIKRIEYFDKLHKKKILKQQEGFVKVQNKLKSQLKEAMSLLENVMYWDTCPDEYIERIKKLKDQ